MGRGSPKMEPEPAAACGCGTPRPPASARGGGGAALAGPPSRGGRGGDVWRWGRAPPSRAVVAACVYCATPPPPPPPPPLLPSAVGMEAPGAAAGPGRAVPGPIPAEGRGEARGKRRRGAGGAGGDRLGLGPVVRAPAPGLGEACCGGLGGGCPCVRRGWGFPPHIYTLRRRPAPRRGAAGVGGEGKRGLGRGGSSLLQRQVVFLHRLECDTKIFLSRRVCVCVSQQNKGGGGWGVRVCVCVCPCIQKAPSVCCCAGAYKRVAEAES